MAKIFLTESQLMSLIKEDISVVKKDKKKEIFNYRDVTNDAWRELVQDAKDTQRISFDLENDDSTGEKKTFYVKKDLRKDQPVKYEFNVELMEAGGDWEWPVMYFRVEFTHEYFYSKLKKESPEYTFQKDNHDKKLYKCYVIIPPVEAGNKLIKGDGDKYDWTAYQDSELSKEEEKKARITDADKRSVWKWIEDLLNNLVEENHEMLDGTSNETKPQRVNEDQTIITTDDAKKIESFAKGFIGILSPHQLENNELNNKSSKILKTLLAKLNFEYVIGIGEWDDDADTMEQSYIIKKPSEIGERPFLKTLKLIAKKFNQEAFIFGKEGGYTLYFLNGETKPLGSTIEFGDEEYVSFNFA